MSKRKYRRHAFIPDVQVKPGGKINHIEAAGNYLAEQPEVIVIAGDWWDMPSLSSYDSDAAKIVAEVSVDADLDAGYEAMSAFFGALRAAPKYRPTVYFLMGNHEYRIERYVAENPMLKGTVSYDSLGIADFGFRVIPFLQPITVDGVSYCHYYCVDSNGRVMNSKRGQASARAQVNNVGMSATSGHKQGLDVYVKESPAGRKRGLIAGSFYQHQEKYLGPQGNSHWQGILLKHEVCNGDYDLLEVSLGYLLRKYQ
jgi:hypothetical protein